MAFRETLTRLRCDARLISDSPCASLRDAGRRMLKLIDYALLSQVDPPAPATIESLPSSELLRELARRMVNAGPGNYGHAGRPGIAGGSAPRGVKQVCSKCKAEPARARGLGMKCYKRALRRGEIQVQARG